MYLLYCSTSAIRGLLHSNECPYLTLRWAICSMLLRTLCWAQCAFQCSRWLKLWATSLF